MSDKCYIVSWESIGNLTNNKDIVVFGDSVSEAQDAFLSWLKEQPIYEHLWNLTFHIKKADYVR